MSANDTKLQNIITDIKKINVRLNKIKKADTSVLLDRISKVEGIIETQSSQLQDVKQEIKDAEGRITSWSEKEFKKLYDIINDNPLGR
jgi:chromosome segregation ATPase